jgi:hypothetical protein
MITLVYDVTHANIGSVPKGAQLALYATGSGSVPATQADFKAHPGALWIDQTPAGSVQEAETDGDDMENGAVQLSELAGRAKLRMASFDHADRPGQRRPFVYASLSNITPVVNALISGGVLSGVHFWVANWSLSQAAAMASVQAAAGPFPIAGVQFHNDGPFDTSVFSTSYLADVSGVKVTEISVPNCDGMTAGAAHNALVAAKLIPTATAGQHPSDKVRVTIPPAGAIVEPGSRVEIITSTPGVEQGIVITSLLTNIPVSSDDGGATWAA